MIARILELSLRQRRSRKREHIKEDFSIQRLLALSLAAIALTGCDSRRAADAPEETATSSIALFKEGKGVLFTDETKALLNTEIAEVQEKSIIRRFEKSAQVFRSPSLERPGGVTILLDAEEMKRVRAGQPVQLKRIGDGSEFMGKVVRIDASALAAFGQVEALVEFSGLEALNPVGRFLTASFTAGEARTALVVPKPAMLTTAEGCFVYVVNGGWLTRTRVKPGTTDGDFVEIEDGLYAGDAIAAKGVANLWFVELSALKGGQPCCPVPKTKSGN